MRRPTAKRYNTFVLMSRLTAHQFQINTVDELAVAMAVPAKYMMDMLAFMVADGLVQVIDEGLIWN